MCTVYCDLNSKAVTLLHYFFKAKRKKKTIRKGAWDLCRNLSEKKAFVVGFYILLHLKQSE